MYGCTDPTSLNYNPNANINDGSCKYESISGCTDPTSLNYNPLATIDDGSCKYEDISSVTKIYYVWSFEGTINYIDENGVSQSKVGVEYDSIKIRYQKDSITFDGDIREYAKQRPIENTYKQYRVTNLFVDDASVNPNAFGQVNRVQVSYMNDSDILKISDEMGPGDSIEFCAQKDSVVPPLGWLGRNVKIVELGDCGASDIVIGVDPRPDIKYNSVEGGQELTTVYGTGPNGEVTSEEIIIDTRTFR